MKTSLTAPLTAQLTAQQPSPLFSHTAFSLVAIAASAGGLQALSQILANLPRELPGAIAVVQHLAPHKRSYLVPILAKRSRLIVKQAEPGERLCSGVVYVAPPDRHLLIHPDSLSLQDSARVNFVRPAADCLFKSVAQSFGQRAIAVVLTGTGRDGAAGIQAIKQRGGVTIAQDQPSSEFFGMPSAAIETQSVDWVLPLQEIAPALIRLVTLAVD